MSSYSDELLLRLEEHGYRGRIVSISHLRELEEEIAGRWSQGLFDEEFYKSRLTFFDFTAPESLPHAKSIIVVAVPSSQAQVTFTYEGKRRDLILPPTYVANQQVRQHVAELLTDALEKEGYSVALTTLPLKPLATRSGLSEYGRNNITYVSGMGSFLQLVSVYSDLPCEQDAWGEAKMMRRCENCQACRRSCPTGAISADRFLLHAERCIAFLNERKGDFPFPNWVAPSWHNSLFGCLFCQRACPENKPFLSRIGEREEFSQEETELILKGHLPDNLPSKTLDKLKNLDLADPDSLSSLPRNLRVLLTSNKPV